MLHHYGLVRVGGLWDHNCPCGAGYCLRDHIALLSAEYNGDASCGAVLAHNCSQWPRAPGLIQGRSLGESSSPVPLVQKNSPPHPRTPNFNTLYSPMELLGSHHACSLTLAQGFWEFNKLMPWVYLYTISLYTPRLSCCVYKYL